MNGNIFLDRFVQCLVFTALHWMQRGLVRRKLSVCRSVKRGHCDKTEESSVQIFIPYERSFSLVFEEEEWLVGATPSTWNLGLTGPRCSEIADFEPIFARSASAVTPSENSSINTNRKSTLRAFQWAQDEHRIVCKGGSQKRKVSTIWTISCDNCETITINH